MRKVLAQPIVIGVSVKPFLLTGNDQDGAVSYADHATRRMRRRAADDRMPRPRSRSEQPMRHVA